MLRKSIRQRAGFTLIELVVVIAILGILVGIAIPRYMNMKEEALGARILADLGAIESAANMYLTTTGKYPDRINDYTDKQGHNYSLAASQLVTKFLTSWPATPASNGSYFRVVGNDGTVYRYQIIKDNVLYAWNGPDPYYPNAVPTYRATIGRCTVDDLKNSVLPNDSNGKTNSYIKRASP